MQTGDINVSTEAMYHLTRSGESVLDYAYSHGGVRGQKEEIRKQFRIKLTLNRTRNFMNKFGSAVVDEHRLKTWKKYFEQGKITKEEYYSKIESFKRLNKKYLSQGSK